MKMKLVAPPLYVLNTTTLDKDQVRTMTSYIHALKAGS